MMATVGGKEVPQLRRGHLASGAVVVCNRYPMGRKTGFGGRRVMDAPNEPRSQIDTMAASKSGVEAPRERS